MEYRLIAVDLDDSLLGDDLKISEANKRALEAARSMGVSVTIATGRMLNSAMPYIRELNIDIPVMTYQGAFIKDTLTGETLKKQTIPLSTAIEVIKECDNSGLYVQAYTEDSYYFSKENEFSRLYHRLSGIKGSEVGDLKLWLKEEPIKLLIIADPQQLSHHRPLFQDKFGSRLQIAVSKPNYLEITHTDANKGKALQLLSGMLGIPRESIIAVGDSYNDMPMIEYAGLGVAMGNAPDKVKACARYVTGSNTEDGIAEVVEKFILKRGPFVEHNIY